MFIKKGIKYKIFIRKAEVNLRDTQRGHINFKDMYLLIMFIELDLIINPLLIMINFWPWYLSKYFSKQYIITFLILITAFIHY